MCGLYGMAGNLSYKDKDFLKALAIVSTLRGEDSAGLLAVPTKGGAPVSMKTVGTSHDLFDLSSFDKLNLYDKGMLIGHTRKATISSISKKTAHPFSYDHIHGVHNGTLQRWSTLPVEGGAEETDSMTCYKAIAQNGLKDTINRLAGAYALVFYDQNEGTLNILRNSQRSLFYAFSEDFSKLVWASEAWMLWAANTRVDWSFANLAKKDETPAHVLPVETDTWWRIKVGSGIKDALTFLKDERIEGDVIKPEVKTYGTPFAGHGQNSNRMPFDWETSPHNPKNKEAATTSTPAASASTSSPTSSSTSLVPSANTSSQQQASQSPRPTLSLVPPSKSHGSSESAPSASESGDSNRKAITTMVIADLPDDDLDAASVRCVRDQFGNPMSKEDFSKTDEKCSFCQCDVDYDDALEHSGGATHIPGVGRWLGEHTFLCSTCTPTL